MGMLRVISSANFTNWQLLGSTGDISFTITEKRTGPSTVPCGTPRLMSKNSVILPSTATLCFLLLRKSVNHFITYGLISRSLTLLQTILCETVSNALVKSNEITLTVRFLIQGVQPVMLTFDQRQGTQCYSSFCRQTDLVQ